MVIEPLDQFRIEYDIWFLNPDLGNPYWNHFHEILNELIGYALALMVTMTPS